MKAYRMGNTIIAAWFEKDAVTFFCEETGGPPAAIEEIDVEETAPEGGRVKDVINKVLDERNEWLRMGVPCELDWPFFVCKSL